MISTMLDIIHKFTMIMFVPNHKHCKFIKCLCYVIIVLNLLAVVTVMV